MNSRSGVCRREKIEPSWFTQGRGKNVTLLPAGLFFSMKALVPILLLS